MPGFIHAIIAWDDFQHWQYSYLLKEFWKRFKGWIIIFETVVKTKPIKNYTPNILNESANQRSYNMFKSRQNLINKHDKTQELQVAS